MQQRYPCPRCGVPVEYGSRFCSNCGNMLQMSPPPSPPNPQYPPQPQPYQPQPWGQQPPPYGQQPGWNQPHPSNQAPGWGGPPPYQQQNMYGQRGTMPQKKGSSNSLIYLVILCVIVFTIGGIILATNGNFFSPSEPVSKTPSPTVPTTPGETPPATTPTPPPPPTPPQTPKYPAAQATPITAAELIAAYSTDSNEAISKYQDNEYAISGTISEARSSSPPFLYLKDSAAGRVEIQCNFSQGKEAEISALDVGQTIKIEGRIGTFTGTILIVHNCKLVQ